MSDEHTRQDSIDEIRRIRKEDEVSSSGSNDLLVCDVIHEFIGDIPSFINDMPAFVSNGVTRNEMEWKHLAFAMAEEIIRLRKAN